MGRQLIAGSLHHGERNRFLDGVIHRDLESASAGFGDGNVEHEYGTGFDLRHAGWWLREVHDARPAENFVIVGIQQANAHRVFTDLGPFALEAQDQMQSRVHGRKSLDPEVLEDPEHRQLPEPVHQRVVAQEGERDLHEAG